MNNQNTGGPAFPPTHDPETHPSGLTIRDFFAAKAMQSLLAQNYKFAEFDNVSNLASISVCVADAMLKERAE